MQEIKLNGESMNIVEDNIEKLKTIFPDVFTEGKVDFEKLQGVLGNYIETNDERYNFTWAGKQNALRLAQTPSTGTLRPCKEESKNWDTTQNLYIEGDNLEVLKLLQKSYHNKIKMIYIDPPYNTGNDFVYKDDFKDNIENYKKITGQVDEEGNKISSNSESDGRYHTNWLNMMYPRLRLARNLLSDDGVIFISIDDNELRNLKNICDEIFGEDNFINLISVFAKASSGASGGGEDKKLKKNIEYLLIYQKSTNFKRFNSIYKEENLEDYIDTRIKQGKNFAYTNVFIEDGEEEYFGETTAGNGDIIKLKKVKNYIIKSVSALMKEENLSREEIYCKYFDKIFTLENAQTSIRDRVIEACGQENDFFNSYYYPVSGKNKGILTKVGFMGTTKRLVSFLSNVAEKKDNKIIKKDKIGTLWDNVSWSNVSNEGGITYNNGKKPVALINQIIKLIDLDDNYTVLDFFSGSATTAHSVIEYNINKNYEIKYIMVQMPENMDKALEKCGNPKTKKEIKELIKILDNLKLPHFVTEIGKERIRQAGEKIKQEIEQENQQLKLGEEPKKVPDIGFKVFKLDSSNIKKWNANTENLEEQLQQSILNQVVGRTELDVVYEIMLKCGLDLTYPIEEIKVEDKTLYSVGAGAMFICMNDNITQSIADKIIAIKEEKEIEEPVVVFKDNGFIDDSTKTNTKESLRVAGIKDFITV